MGNSIVTVITQAGPGITAGANAGKGNGTDSNYMNSHIGSKDSATSISSGGATNIIGGQIQGKGVQIG